MHVGGATHTHTIGPTCDLSGPRANQRAHVRVIGPRCALMGSRIGPVGMFLPHDETTTLNTDVSVPAHRKIAIKPTRFVRPHSWCQPTKTTTFPHQKAEKSPQNQHILSFNPQITCAHTTCEPMRRPSEYENPRASFEARGSCAETAGFEPARGYAPLPP